MNEIIIDKIKKLLAMSKSSNEHEAKASLLKAQELLVKYKLTMKDVQSYAESPIIDKVSGVSFKRARWKAHLASVIADNFGCYMYMEAIKTNYIVFLGKEEDVTICNIVFDYALDSIEAQVKRLRYKYRVAGRSTKGLENDYGLGFLYGLQKAYEKQRADNQEWGLVLAKDKKVTEAYERRNFSRSEDYEITLNDHDEALRQGYKDGENFSISDKISGASEEPIMLN